MPHCRFPCVAPAISRRGLDTGRFSAVPAATRLASCENLEACLTRHANVRNRISLWQIGPGQSRKFSDAGYGLRLRTGWLQVNWADDISAAKRWYVKVGWPDGCENQSVGRGLNRRERVSSDKAPIGSLFECPLYPQAYWVVTPERNRSITKTVKTISFIAYTTPKSVTRYYTANGFGTQVARTMFFSLTRPVRPMLRTTIGPIFFRTHVTDVRALS